MCESVDHRPLRGDCPTSVLDDEGGGKKEGWGLDALALDDIVTPRYLFLLNLLLFFFS